MTDTDLDLRRAIIRAGITPREAIKRIESGGAAGAMSTLNQGLLKALKEALDALLADPDDFELGEYDQIVESAKHQAELAIAKTEG